MLMWFTFMVAGRVWVVAPGGLGCFRVVFGACWLLRRFGFVVGVVGFLCGVVWWPGGWFEISWFCVI